MGEALGWLDTFNITGLDPKRKQFSAPGSNGGTYNDEKNARQAREQEAAAATAEQKALQDQQEERKTKASTRLAMSTSGFSGGTNSARSFLTTF